MKPYSWGIESAVFGFLRLSCIFLFELLFRGNFCTSSYYVMDAPSQKKTKLMTTYFKPKPFNSDDSNRKTAEMEVGASSSASQDLTGINRKEDRSSLTIDPFDIAIKFCRKGGKWNLNENCVLTDAQKVNLLQNHRLPDEKFVYPFRVKKSQKVFLSQGHATGKNS